MKKILTLFTLFFSATFYLNGQQKEIPIYLGTRAEFTNKFKSKAPSASSRAASKDGISLKLDEGKTFLIDLSSEKKAGNTNVFTGKARNKNSKFILRNSMEKAEGSLILNDTKEGFKIYTDAADNVYAQAVDIQSLVCIDYQKQLFANPPESTTYLPEGQSAYSLQSYPSATAVVLLDFDGQFVPAGVWGGDIDALPALFNNDEIFETWQMVSEDFRPFHLNITTSEAVYQNAPANMRMRVNF